MLSVKSISFIWLLVIFSFLDAHKSAAFLFQDFGKKMIGSTHGHLEVLGLLYPPKSSISFSLEEACCHQCSLEGLWTRHSGRCHLLGSVFGGTSQPRPGFQHWLPALPALSPPSALWRVSLVLALCSSHWSPMTAAAAAAQQQPVAANQSQLPYIPSPCESGVLDFGSIL